MEGALAAAEILGAAAIAGWLWVAVRRDARRGPATRCATPPAPRYRLALCEGPRCIPAADLDGRCPSAADGEAVLACRAAQYRTAGAVGRLLLVEAASGAVVASRRVWP